MLYLENSSCYRAEKSSTHALKTLQDRLKVSIPPSAKVPPKLSRPHCGQEGLSIPGVEGAMVTALATSGEHLSPASQGYGCFQLLRT